MHITIMIYQVHLNITMKNMMMIQKFIDPFPRYQQQEAVQLENVSKLVKILYLHHYITSYPNHTLILAESPR